MKYDIIWSAEAKASLKRIFNPIAAEKILSGVQKTVKDLYFMPDRGALIDELQQLQIYGYRMLLYKRWKILYEVNHQARQVLIALVIDSSRDFRKIILTEIKP